MHQNGLTVRGNHLARAFTEHADKPVLRESPCQWRGPGGCTAAGVEIAGYYLVGSRRVRVWYCAEHNAEAGGSPTVLLPLPPSIKAALDAEEEYIRKMSRQYRHNQDPERGVSVKVFAPTGFGDPVSLPGRAQAFRWTKVENPRRLTPEEAEEAYDNWLKQNPHARRHERVASRNRFMGMVDWKGLGLTKGSINGRPIE